MREDWRMKFKGLPYYWGAIATTKCIKAILFMFLPAETGDKVKLEACTGWVRHMGRFYENRIYTFTLNSQLTKGEVEVLLLDQKKQTLLKLNRQNPTQSIHLDGESSRYYLQWKFQSSSGKCELLW